MQKIGFLFRSNLFMSGLYKAISGLSLFISIPLLISFLGDENFGIWILVFALFQWILLMDLGISSVLKTKIPILKLEKNTDLLNAYIQSTYKITVGIAIASFLIFSIIIHFLDLKIFLKIQAYDSAFISNLFILNIGLFCLQFILNTHKSLFVGFLKGKFAEKSIAVNQFIFLISIFLLEYFFSETDSGNKLILVSICNGFIGIAVHFGYTIYLFKTEKISLKNRVQSPKNFIKELYKLGIKFMIIQTCFIFIFNLDTYIISSYFGSSEVVQYEILSKYFQFPLMVLMAALSPLWSIFAKHYYEKNYAWLLEGFKKFNLSFLAITILFIFFALAAPFVFPIWISQNFTYSNSLFISIGILTVFRLYSLFYGFFLSGIGKLKYYIITLILSVILKLPLTILLIELDFGIASVAIASSILVFFWCIFQPIESYTLIKENFKKTRF